MPCLSSRLLAAKVVRETLVQAQDRAGEGFSQHPSVLSDSLLAPMLGAGHENPPLDDLNLRWGGTGCGLFLPTVLRNREAARTDRAVVCA